MSARKKSKTTHRKATTADSDVLGSGATKPPTNGDSLRGNTGISRQSESRAIGSRSADNDERPSNNKAGRKWLAGGGSWRTKAPAIVKTAKESIGVAGGATAEISDETADDSNQASPKKFLSKRKSSKGDTVPASITQLNVTSDGLIGSADVSLLDETSKDLSSEPTLNTDEPPLPPDPSKAIDTKPSGSFGWRSWWSRPDGYTSISKPKDLSTTVATDEAENTPLPGTTPLEETLRDDKTNEDMESTYMRSSATRVPNAELQKELEASDLESDKKQNGTDSVALSEEQKRNKLPGASTSWFRLWSTTQNAQTSAVVDVISPGIGDAAVPESPWTQEAIEEGSDPSKSPLADQDRIPSSKAGGESESPVPHKPSGWAFWFRGKPRTEDQRIEGARKQVGEVAVFDTPSQAQPEAAQFNERKAQPVGDSEVPANEAFSKPSSKPSSIQPPTDSNLADDSHTKKTSKSHSRDQQDIPVTNATPGPSVGSEPLPGAVSSIKSTTKKQASANPKEAIENTILPEFSNTFRFIHKPTYWQRIRQYFLGGEDAIPHLYINPEPPIVRKAIAIGVHGYFPAPIFQRVLGQPTGTSIRFANAARDAIDAWTRARGYSAEIEQIALEGEGFIAERVNTLWKLLLNWIEHLKAADFILIACHSQGVPVAIMLAAKLIQFGCIKTARVGVCAMAGVNMGPFIEYKTKYFGPTAAELFEFGNPTSLVSQMYLAALDEVLRYGVRVLYVGSIDDQLVSLESSTFSTLSHPYVYRAVFVDGRIHAPDFLTHLVGFTLKLRNLGLPDHGLIRELSPALAGSLYGGEGHSRVYEDTRVYKLAVEHALETISLPTNTPQKNSVDTGSFTGISVPVPGAKPHSGDPYALQVKNYESKGSTNQNPYYLPWAMRGLLEEEFVKKELGQEVKELLAMFEQWRPTSKQLKDVKFRLEVVRSKL